MTRLTFSGVMKRVHSYWRSVCLWRGRQNLAELFAPTYPELRFIGLDERTVDLYATRPKFM